MSHPVFFETPSDLRAWFSRNYTKEKELLVGFYKKDSGKPSITWPESVDQAICFGWIDGVRRTIDGESYSIRFTPRKPKSIWSAVNIRKAEELTAKGLMMPEGLKAFELREDHRSRIYSFEQGDIHFDETSLKLFKKNKKAWAFFESQPPSYRKPATWWVISAKQEATRSKRIQTLIADSESGIRVAHLRRAPATKK
jgi:uncharacterized protein YdeI (YjbR/CyaY-like superfamily)